ncbi:UDP-glucosyltransferase 2-like isoform X1 [Galleria mellonella]|uniref:UDP-glucuronosyltransferase n=1 Tax=Galleria mellonella TaxID=7137 RepID=A0ABM3MXZ0_GALME|nr:UDP-glucosyltransferase 2-like isoform X1 [Galleria mellonella]
MMRILFISYLTILTFNNVNCSRILALFPHTGKSHHMVFEPLLKTLIERGHNVTVASIFPVNVPPEKITEISLKGIAEEGVETIDLAEYSERNVFLRLIGLDDIVQQIECLSVLADMALDTCTKLMNWPTLKKALRNEYDVVLVENFNTDCMLGLLHVYEIKAPVIALLSSYLMPWSAERIGLTENFSYMPVLTSAFKNPNTFIERLESTVMNYYFKFWYRYAIQIKEQEIIEKYFGRKIVDLNDLAKNTTLMMMNTFHSLNGVKPLLPGLVEVGGMHVDETKKYIPPYIEKFLNESEHGVILLSFGSLIKTSTIPKYKEEIIIRVLSKFKQRVIWKYEDSDEEGTLVGNILKVRWIPQYELLKHKKVLAFIGHGGLLGMTEAVSVGKPMVVVPFYGDQPTNAAAAASIGFAKKISYADINDDTLFEAVQSVLSAEMRLSARLVSKMWHDRQSKPLDTAVYWVERVIRWGHKDPLHSPARDLNFIQLSLLDVGAALAVILIVLVLILKAILLLILRVIKVSFNVNVKEKKH